MNTHRVEVAYPLHAQLGECPTWLEDALFCVDIEAGHLLKCVSGQQVQTHSFGERIGFALPAEADHWIVGLESGVYTYGFSEKTLMPLVSPNHQHAANRFNDAATDPKGEGFLVGTLNKDGLPDQAELYDIDSSYTSRRMVENVGMSNGLVWSVDGRILYYIDSLARGVDAFDWDQSERTLLNRRQVFRLGDESGIPDGMTIDQKGNLWIALWGGNAVIAVDPVNGDIVDRIELPVSQVTSCCFGGTDDKTLYITTANVGLNDDQLREEPHAGDIFTVRLETGGFPTPRFQPRI